MARPTWKVNSFLPPELDEELDRKRVTIDNRQKGVVGKTIALEYDDGASVGLVFTDGTWVLVSATGGSCEDEAYIEHSKWVSAWDLYQLELITSDQYIDVCKAEELQMLANKQLELDSLRKSLGVE